MISVPTSQASPDLALGRRAVAQSGRWAELRAMHRFATCSLIALMTLTIGCDYYHQPLLQEGQRLEARRNAVLASARQSVSFAREFDQLFSGGHTSAGEGRFGWTYDFQVGLYGRYIVEGQVPLTVDTNTMNVVGSGLPVIYVREVGRVIPSSEEGGVSATYTTNQAQLGAEEWQKLVESRGDFSVVGYGMVTNMPIPNFDRIGRFPGSVNR